MAVMFLSRLFSTIFPHPGTLCFWCDGVSLHYCFLLNMFLYLDFAPVVDFWFPGLQKTMHGGRAERKGLLLFFDLQKVYLLMTLTRPHPYAWLLEWWVHGAYDYRIEISSHNIFRLTFQFLLSTPQHNVNRDTAILAVVTADHGIIHLQCEWSTSGYSPSVMWGRYNELFPTTLTSWPLIRIVLHQLVSGFPAVFGM